MLWFTFTSSLQDITARIIAQFTIYVEQVSYYCQRICSLKSQPIVDLSIHLSPNLLEKENLNFNLK